jgi:threonylcarbamoyladenosine tRNA methylthiotransferase MtaB
MHYRPVIAFHTLGCKLNQAEAEFLSWKAAEAGYHIGGKDNADIHIINTCTVTHIADRKSRHLVRMIKKRNPEAFVIVTGCYAERDANALARAGADCVVDNTGKMQVVELISSISPPESIDTVKYDDSGHTARIRSFIKIQDGCNAVCSYCIVPLVRSNVYSPPVEEVVSTVVRRVTDGYKEAVLTGTEIGTYRDGDVDLCRLIRQILDRTEIQRLHLSSLQPQEISPQLLALWQDSRMYRHFHVALQSGSASVLKRMRRRYSLAEYAGSVSLIRRAVPDAAITADIMVGFPGESDGEFDESYRFCRDMEFADIHIFSYSPRPGTAAATMAGQVADTLKKERSNRMLGLARESSHRFMERFLGETRTVLWENEEGKRRGLYSGLTDNYIRVFTVSDSILTNSILPVWLVGLYESGMKGELVRLTG